MSFDKDPLGYAITDFAEHGTAENIIIKSKQSDDDIFPVPYFFRTLDMMPELEQTALELSRGKVLDVGAGAGCHSIILSKRGLDVTAIDTSAGAVEIMKKAGLNASVDTIFTLDKKFDTILILMNGVGLAGDMENLTTWLSQLKKLLAAGGKIYTDSTDIGYLYTEEDGSMLIDLNAPYYGEMQFKMTYKTADSGWFSWLYIDFDNLCAHAAEAGLSCTLVAEGPSNNYLVCLEHL